MFGRWLTIGSLLALTALGSCRCSDDAAAGDRDGGSTLSTNELINDTGENVVRTGREKVRHSRPPALPGEKRRLQGAGTHPEPTEDDPTAGEFTLEQATEGLGGSGALVAEIDANLGRLRCELYAEKAPNTVANFVGLARGKRPWWDTHRGMWVRERFYDGLTFHKVVPGSLVTGGCPWGSGDGGPGYEIEAEITEELAHDRPGVISMVEGNASQFVILDGPAPHLNGRQSVFGHCEPTKAVFRIARVPQAGENRPLTDVMIRSVRIGRAD